MRIAAAFVRGVDGGKCERRGGESKGSFLFLSS